MAVVAVEVATIAVLHRIGSQPGLQIPWSTLDSWLITTSPEAAIAAGIRLAALGCAYWMLATTVLYTLARVAGIARAARALEWATLPVVRRAVDRLVAVALASTLANGSAVAVADVKVPVPSPTDAVVEIYVPVPAGDGEADTEPGGSASNSPTPSASPIAQASPAPSNQSRDRAQGHDRQKLRERPRRPVRETGVRQREREVGTIYAVVNGDNLWDIAAEHLAARLGRPLPELSNAEIASYWHRVIAANRGNLASGDPNLIFPGEIVHCPPVVSQG